MKFGLHFGALADDIADQLKKQGMKFDAEQIKRFQKNADAITQLRFAMLLPDSQSEKCQKKLYKQIVYHVVKINKLKVEKV